MLGKKTRFCLLLLVNLYCSISDPKYREKILLNTEYTGFITRDFYQVIIEINVSNADTSITRDREDCQKKSLRERDRIVVNQLRNLSIENDSNQKGEPYKLNPDNYEYYVGDYSWFLNGMFLFQEDYSDPKKCKFIYRIIQKNLFSRVQETRLTLPNPKKKEILKKDQDGVPKQAEQINPNPTQPLVPGISK